MFCYAGAKPGSRTEVRGKAHVEGGKKERRNRRVTTRVKMLEEGQYKLVRCCHCLRREVFYFVAFWIIIPIN